MYDLLLLKYVILRSINESVYIHHLEMSSWRVSKQDDVSHCDSATTPAKHMALLIWHTGHSVIVTERCVVRADVCVL